MANAYFLGKEIRRLVKKWEVVDPWIADLYEEPLAMEVEPSEEDRAVVFGPEPPLPVPPPAPLPPSSNAIAASLFARRLLPSPASTVTPSPASTPAPSLAPPMIDSTASSSSSGAAAAPTLSTAPSKPTRKMARDARAKKHTEKIKRRRAAKRVARAAAAAGAPAAPSSSTSASPSSLPPPAANVARRGESGNFKNPQIPKRKSVVVALKPSSPSFPSASTIASSSGQKRVPS